MKYADTLRVVCQTCGFEQFQDLSQLESSTAYCCHCGASMAEKAKELKELKTQIKNQVQYVVDPLTDLELHFGISIPESFEWDKIRTKADYIKRIVALLREVAPEKAKVEAVAMAFDESLIRRGLRVPKSLTTPLF